MEVSYMEWRRNNLWTKTIITNSLSTPRVSPFRFYPHFFLPPAMISFPHELHPPEFHQPHILTSQCPKGGPKLIFPHAPFAISNSSGRSTCSDTNVSVCTTSSMVLSVCATCIRAVVLQYSSCNTVTLRPCIVCHSVLPTLHC